jgi:hypothetical protein
MYGRALNHIHAAMPHLVCYKGFILLHKMFPRMLAYNSRKFVRI